MNNLSVLLLNLMCMCVLIAFLITGGVMVANRPSQELPVWFHVPLCQNVEHATCPAGPAQFSATAPPTVANVGDAAGGCCLTVTPKSTYMASQKVVVGGGTANLPYPALNLASTWFAESEFVSGEPAFTDYTGSKASSSATLQPRRAFTGQCVRTDPTPTNTPRDRSAADGGAASSFSFVVPTNLMVKGFRYMPKILRTDTLELWDAEVVVSKAGPGLGPDACSSADQEAKTCRRWTFNNATADKRRRVCASVTNPFAPSQSKSNKVSLPDTSDNSAAAGGRRRRRNLLKGGGSSYGGYAGSEPSYRTRNGRSVTYLSSSRRRTSYGYTERQHVIAADAGTTIRVDPPSYFATNTTTAASAKDTFPTASLAINEATLTTGSAMYNKQRKLFHATTVGLGDRRGYPGSKGFAEMSVAARMGSYSTDFAFSLYKKATEQVVYADLAADQFGEDDAVDSLFTYDGGTELVLTVRFRGMSNPYANVADSVQRSVAFPKVFVALVTPDDDANYGVGCLLLVVGALGLPCLFFAFLNCVENDTLEDTCGDDETCCVEPCMTCACCKSSGKSSSRHGGRYDSDISTYNPMKSAGADGASMKADTAFDTFMSNGIQLGVCRGRVYRDVNGDHVSVPCGMSYAYIDISTNDVSNLNPYTTTEWDIKYLNVHNNDISSLSGIEKYRSLTTLIVTNNNLSSLNTQSPNQDSELVKLDVGGNDIVRLGFGISKFRRLKLLMAPNNDIVNLKGLSSACPALECVDFRNNSLGKSAIDTSIAELAPLRNLKYVHLGHNDIKSKDELIIFGKTCSDSLCHINISSNDLPKSSLRQFRSILKGRGMNVRVIADDEDAMTGGAASGTAIAMAVPIS